ncbi:MAG: CopD family protein [Acidisphaera sp.]|nr:CopD family protein [Acidisphaera sp.]
MSLLLDLFGYLSVVLHGLTIVAQSMALGSTLFVVCLARPLAARLGASGRCVVRDSTGIAFWSAIGLIVCLALDLAMQSAVLVGTIDLTFGQALGADFAIADMVQIAAAAVLAVALRASGGEAPAPLLLAALLADLAAATLTTHAAARLEDRGLLLAAEGLHQFGAAIWIGGIPCFVAALARLRQADRWGGVSSVVGLRFSRMSMAGVGCLLASGITMSLFYVGSWAGLYGTAYGVMVCVKISLFLVLLALGAGNFLAVERLRQDPRAPVLRLRRFAEVEIGIGFSVFFAAASLTSVPPAIDLLQDRVSWPEIVERFTPQWPRLVSPDHDRLALPALQERLDREAAQHARAPQAAFIPGAGTLPPRNADDVAWSEFNHHWAGLFLLAIGLLALLHQAGLRVARHWPLLFIGLAAFLFLRSDPEVWPLGQEGLIASLRDVEVLQHRMFVLLICAFGGFEWRVRTGAWRSREAALVFPLVCAVGGALLLTHSHAIANVREQLLIELTHAPLAVLAILAGWSRWLQLRLDAPGNRIAGWVWPVCFVLIAGLLLDYREA